MTEKVSVAYQFKHKPKWEVYELSARNIERMCEFILEKHFSHHVTLSIKPHGGSGNSEPVFSINTHSIPHSIVERMKQIDVSNGSITKTRLFFLYELFDTIGVKIEHSHTVDNTTTEIYRLWVPAREDVQKKLRDIIDESLISSREETIIMLNKFLKEMKPE